MQKAGFLTTRIISFLYDNAPMQYTAIFHDRKNNNFQMKNCDNFLDFAQNIVGTLTGTVLTRMFKSKNKKKVYPGK